MCVFVGGCVCVWLGEAGGHEGVVTLGFNWKQLLSAERNMQCTVWVQRDTQQKDAHSFFCTSAVLFMKLVFTPDSLLIVFCEFMFCKCNNAVLTESSIENSVMFKLLIIWLGMGIENRFLFRTGSQWTDSLESLAKFFNDSVIGSLCVCACANLLQQT